MQAESYFLFDVPEEIFRANISGLTLTSCNKHSLWPYVLPPDLSI